MKAYLDCIPCFFKQALQASRMATDNEQKQKRILDDLARELPGIPLGNPPPYTGRLIHRIVREISGCSDPYSKVKEEYNRKALALYPELKSIVNGAEDPLLEAIRVAIAGNVIDFGITSNFNIEEELKRTLSQDFAILDYKQFREALSGTDEILYLADNSGETVFDRVLIEHLNSYRVTYAVKEIPIINDATVEDAEFSGIGEIAEIVSSGSDAPGTILELCTPEFLKLYNMSRLIIAKGQGNYEVLSEERKPIFFLLKAKCPIIARDLKVQVGDIVLKKQERNN